MAPRPALLDAVALEPWAVAVVWPVAARQVVVPEVVPVWVAWGGGGVGAAGRGGVGVGGRGALARARGGVVGACGQGCRQGRWWQRGLVRQPERNAGWRSWRGWWQGGRRSEKESSQGDRPDYLVEDEETWISEEDRNRNVPRTIE